MRFALLGCDGLVSEREWLLLPILRRLEVRLVRSDVMVSSFAEWIKDVDFRVALVVST